MTFEFRIVGAHYIGPHDMIQARTVLVGTLLSGALELGCGIQVPTEIGIWTGTIFALQLPWSESSRMKTYTTVSHAEVDGPVAVTIWGQPSHPCVLGMATGVYVPERI